MFINDRKSNCVLKHISKNWILGEIELHLHLIAPMSTLRAQCKFLYILEHVSLTYRTHANFISVINPASTTQSLFLCVLDAAILSGEEEEGGQEAAAVRVVCGSAVPISGAHQHRRARGEVTGLTLIFHSSAC